MTNICAVFGITVSMILFLLNTVRGDIILTSCTGMNTPIFEDIANGACNSSCEFQNCGSGSCKKRSGRPVCVCSRCDNGGGEWPILPSGGKGK